MPNQTKPKGQHTFVVRERKREWLIVHLVKPGGPQRTSREGDPADRQRGSTSRQTERENQTDREGEPD